MAVKQKYIFLDIDGTLFSPQLGRIPESALAAVKEARANGSKVFLCTGRALAGCSKYLAMDIDGFVFAAGAMVYADHQRIFDQPLSKSDESLLKHIIREAGMGYVAEGQAGGYCDPIGYEVLSRYFGGLDATEEEQRRKVSENGFYPEYYLDPDTSVAVGAAIQCAMKERDKQVDEVILTDVCPFTLGTEVVKDNGAFEVPGHYLPIIERNTVIPVSKTETVCTAHENQKYVTVKVLQGESRVASNNLLLGELTVEVPVGPKGKESVEITYTYDINSLLEVEVKVLSTGEKKKVIIQDEENRISEEEAEQRLERIQYLKQNPREDEENILVMFRAERIYEECSIADQNRIADKINEFETAMRTKTRIEADSVRKQLHELLDELENRNDRGFLA